MGNKKFIKKMLGMQLAKDAEIDMQLAKDVERGMQLAEDAERSMQLDQYAESTSNQKVLDKYVSAVTQVSQSKAESEAFLDCIFFAYANGQAAKFLVDCGSSYTYMYKDTAENLNITYKPKEEVVAVDFDGYMEGIKFGLAKKVPLRIGSSVSYVDIYVDERNRPYGHEESITLGQDILLKWKTIIKYTEQPDGARFQKLYLPNFRGTANNRKVRDYNYRLDIAIGGEKGKWKKVNALFDTGSSSVYLRNRDFSNLFRDSRKVDLALSNELTVLSEVEYCYDLLESVIVGRDILYKYNGIVDFHSGEVYLQPAGCDQVCKVKLKRTKIK